MQCFFGNYWFFANLSAANNCFLFLPFSCTLLFLGPLVANAVQCVCNRNDGVFFLSFFCLSLSLLFSFFIVYKLNN